MGRWALKGAKGAVKNRFERWKRAWTIKWAVGGYAEDKPIMMYCTGGIRCDVYSTVLKSKDTNVADMKEVCRRILKSLGTRRSTRGTTIVCV